MAIFGLIGAVGIKFLAAGFFAAAVPPPLFLLPPLFLAPFFPPLLLVLLLPLRTRRCFSPTTKFNRAEALLDVLPAGEAKAAANAAFVCGLGNSDARASAN